MNQNNKFSKRLSSLPTYLWSKIAKIDEFKGQ